MQYSLNIALLLFSLIFGSVAIFTICTCVPKATKGLNDPGWEDVWADTLALTPIRRRSDHSQDTIETTGVSEETTAHEAVSIKPKLIRAYPISRLLQSEHQQDKGDEEEKKEGPISVSKREERQQISLTDPANHNASSLSQRIKSNVWNQLLTTMDLYRRDSDLDASTIGSKVELFKSEATKKRQHSIPSANTGSMPDLGTTEDALIDFDKAHRDADLAGLAPGFLIETEYLTPSRKTVQRLVTKASDQDDLGTSFNGISVLHDAADPDGVETADIWTAQDVVGNVLDRIDDQEFTPFIREGFSISKQPSSPSYVIHSGRSPSAIVHLSFPRYDLVR